MVKVLTDEQVETIHEASLKILERTGIRFDSEDARRRLLKAGAAAHPVKKDVVTFPRSIVEEAIGGIPREVTYFASDPDWGVRFDGEYTYPYAGGGDPKTVDLGTGTVKPSTYADVEAAARLGDALENNHFSSHLVIANDVPPEIIELRTVEAAVITMLKQIVSNALSPEGLARER